MEPGDEQPHSPGVDPEWAEWWYFDFAAPAEPAAAGDPALVGCVRLCLLPNQGVARYWASLVGEGRPLVVVHDDEVPLARRRSLEIRTEGLWADHVVEAPFEQVGVGCEAFGLRLDSPADLRRNPVVGERVPFGLDLEWATGPEAAVAGDPDSPPPGSGYRIDCQVYGEVLVADERIELDAPGTRSHGWGTKPPPFVPSETALAVPRLL